MTLTPYLFFSGNCDEALTFYATLFGDGSPDMMRVAGSPMENQVPPDRLQWVLHGSLKTRDGGMLMASDDIFDNSQPMAGASLNLSYPTAAEARSVFEALSEGGDVQMAFEPTFWSAGFGACTDRFGVKWMVGCEEAPAGH